MSTSSSALIIDYNSSNKAGVIKATLRKLECYSFNCLQKIFILMAHKIVNGRLEIELEAVRAIELQLDGLIKEDFFG